MSGCGTFILKGNVVALGGTAILPTAVCLRGAIAGDYEGMSPAAMARRTTLLRFYRCTPRFAGSLKYWREAHEAFFARECRPIGRTPDFDISSIDCAQAATYHVVKHNTWELTGEI